MKRKMLFILSLSLIMILGIGLFWLSQNKTAEAQSNAETLHPFAVLNQKAKNARNGDFAAAKELVGETLSLSGYEDQLRGSTADMIKDRVGK